MRKSENGHTPLTRHSNNLSFASSGEITLKSKRRKSLGMLVATTAYKTTVTIPMTIRMESGATVQKAPKAPFLINTTLALNYPAVQVRKCDLFFSIDIFLKISQDILSRKLLFVFFYQNTATDISFISRPHRAI